jgi:hypothetical protein
MSLESGHGTRDGSDTDEHQGASAHCGKAVTKPHGAPEVERPTADRSDEAGGQVVRGRPAGTPSLRDRLTQFFNAGQNASDRELAVMFGTSTGSISVYRCQLKKLGVGLPSPDTRRRGRSQREPLSESGALGTRRGPKTAEAANQDAEVAPGRSGTPVRRGRSVDPAPPVGAGGPSLLEIGQVLTQNIDSEIDSLIERHPEIAGAVTNVKQTVRLLLKLYQA